MNIKGVEYVGAPTGHLGLVVAEVVIPPEFASAKVPLVGQKSCWVEQHLFSNGDSFTKVWEENVKASYAQGLADKLAMGIDFGQGLDWSAISCTFNPDGPSMGFLKPFTAKMLEECKAAMDGVPKPWKPLVPDLDVVTKFEEEFDKIYASLGIPKVLFNPSDPYPSPTACGYPVVEGPSPFMESVYNKYKTMRPPSRDEQMMASLAHLEFESFERRLACAKGLADAEWAFERGMAQTNYGRWAKEVGL